MTTVIFGDVHGESGKLQALVTEARSQFGEVQFYGVGDFIDRGPDSKGVLQILIDEGILGNHEIWFHQLLNKKIFNEGALHPMMGGRATLDSYGLGIRWPEKNIRRCVPQDHREYILNLPQIRQVEVAGTTYWITHAGMSKAVGDKVSLALDNAFQTHDLEGTPPVELFFEAVLQGNADELFWNHTKVKDPQLYDFGEGHCQVFGHTPFPEAVDGGHFIALDTGCGRKKGHSPLSAIVLHPDGTRQFLGIP